VELSNSSQNAMSCQVGFKNVFFLENLTWSLNYLSNCFFFKFVKLTEHIMGKLEFLILLGIIKL